MSLKKRKARKAKFDKQDGKCLYCGKQTIMFIGKENVNHPDRATLEHLRPKTRWNIENSKFQPCTENVFLCCYKCNSLRGSDRLEDFLQTFHYTCRSEISRRIKQVAKLSETQFREILRF